MSDSFLYLSVAAVACFAGGLTSLMARRSWLDIGVVSAIACAAFYVLLPAYTLALPGLELYVMTEWVASYLRTSALFIGFFFIGLLPFRKIKVAERPFPFSPSSLYRIGSALAILAGGVFLWNLLAQGGVEAVYGRAYGGAWADSGYLREAPLLAVPAAISLALAIRRSRGRPSWRDGLVLVLCLLPLLTHGFLGARRGYIFMGIAALGASAVVSGLVKARLILVAPLVIIMFVTMVTVVSNRQNLYVGGSWEIENDPMEIFELREGQEFVFATALHEAASQRVRPYYGGRYLTVLLIRPIPKQLWPTKYEDASNIFGIPNLEREGQYLPSSDFSWVTGWTQETGSAPGLIADVYIEFGGLGAIFMFLFGLILRLIDDRSHYEELFVIVKYIVVAFFAYAVAQGFEPFIFRVVLVAVPIVTLFMLNSTRRPVKGRPRPSHTIDATW